MTLLVADAYMPVITRSVLAICIWLIMSAASVLAADSPGCWPGFISAPSFDEQVREIRFSSESRAILVAPQLDQFRADQPTLLVIYTTPNGNTVEQTLGCLAADGLDWHFDIQHTAAQVRYWRKIHDSENVVLACLQSEMLSWPAWRQTYADSPQLIREIVDALAAQVPAENIRIVLTGHSGGGSFITGFVNAFDKIPDNIIRIAYLDANYSYSNDEQHGRKFLDWLRTNPQNRLHVLAYDDRNIELDGKKVVGPTGGTYRASHRMLDYLRQQIPIFESKQGEFVCYTGVDGRLCTLIHPNPENKILHTRLVGEMNGLLYALTAGSPGENTWGQIAPPREYTEWIQPRPFEPSKWFPTEPAIPPRSADAPSGTQFATEWLEAAPEEREAAILAELLNGNVPKFLRRFVRIRDTITAYDGSPHEIVYHVMPDYLSIGTNDDFLRVPLTPSTAQFVADVFGCVLPTRKIVAHIHRNATIKLTPQPLTEKREALATFVQHQHLIEEQRDRQGGKSGQLIAGIKKDVVTSNELHSRPGHVAIYGWHYPDGRPVQPLSTIHVDRYVDYSHGVRLIGATVLVDGRPARVQDVLTNKQLHSLLSDEGPIDDPQYHPPTNESK